MGLFASFRPECIQIGSNAGNKGEVLQELARLAKKSKVLDKVPEKQVLRALEQREQGGITGFGQSVGNPLTGATHPTLRSIIEANGGTIGAPTPTQDLTAGYLSGVDVFSTSFLIRAGLLPAEQTALQDWIAADLPADVPT